MLEFPNPAVGDLARARRDIAISEVRDRGLEADGGDDRNRRLARVKRGPAVGRWMPWLSLFIARLK